MSRPVIVLLGLDANGSSLRALSCDKMLEAMPLGPFWPEGQPLGQVDNQLSCDCLWALISWLGYNLSRPPP